MKVEQFLEQIQRLTGTPVKQLNETEIDLLSTAFGERQKVIDYKQFNGERRK